MPDRPRRSYPPAFATSAAFGLVGLVLIVASLASGNDTVGLVGVGMGAVSLVAALVWREQLIEAWRARRESG